MGHDSAPFSTQRMVTNQQRCHTLKDPKAKVSVKYTLSDHLWEYLQSYAAKHRAAGNGFGFGLVGRDDISRTLSARYYKDGSEILVKQNSCNPRRLTPRECARLMGFDKPGESSFVIPVSDTQAYRQFGNAVATPCVGAVARHMAPWLGVPEVSSQSKPPLFERKGKGTVAARRQRRGGNLAEGSSLVV